MKIALAQMDIIWENKEENKNKCSQFIEKAKNNNVEFLLFPEMTLTGFSMNTQKTGEENNETIDWFKKQAKNNNISIGFGYVRNIQNSKSKNCFCIVTNEGEIISEYKKIHPFSFGEESIYYDGGSEIVNYKLSDFLISSFICYDLRFPEIFQIASKQSNLITIAANWPAVRKEHWITLLRARAIENQCYIAAVNRVGEGNGLNYSGNSLIIDPLGNILNTSENAEELIISEIFTEEVKKIRESFKLKADRKESLYLKLYSDRG